MRCTPISVMQKADLPEVIAVHRDAFSGYMNVSLGSWYLRAFFESFCVMTGAIALVARDRQSNCTGYVVGAPVGYERGQNWRLLAPAVFGLVTHPGLVYQGRVRRAVAARVRSWTVRSRPSTGQVPEIPAPAVSLVGIGVKSTARGTGTGGKLMVAFESAARAEGMRAMRLSVYPENATARRLYEKCGWTPLTEQVDAGDSMYYSKELRTAG